MKGRIRRIVVERCRHPKTVTGWVLAVAAVILCISISAAWAQRTGGETKDPNSGSPTSHRQQKDTGTKEDPGRTQQDPLMIEGQRLALKAILEALRNVAGTTEAALLAQGDAKDDVTKILGFELTEIQNHIRRLEGRLASLDPTKSPQKRDQDATGTRKRVRDPNEPTKQVRTPRDRSVGGEDQSAEKIQNQIARAQARLKQLEEQGQGDSEDAQKIRERLRKLREQLAQLETTDQPRQR